MANILTGLATLWKSGALRFWRYTVENFLNENSSDILAHLSTLGSKYLKLVWTTQASFYRWFGFDDKCFVFLHFCNYLFITLWEYTWIARESARRVLWVIYYLSFLSAESSLWIILWNHFDSTVNTVISDVRLYIGTSRTGIRVTIVACSKAETRSLNRLIRFLAHDFRASLKIWCRNTNELREFVVCCVFSVNRLRLLFFRTHQIR